MVKEPKIGELYYFMQDNEVLCGELTGVFGDKDLVSLKVDSPTRYGVFLVEPRFCHEYFDDLVELSLDCIRSIKETRERYCP